MNINIEKLKQIGYQQLNGETYGKKENDFFTKVIQVQPKTNIVVSRYLKTSKLSIVKSDQINELIKFYKELKKEYEECLIKGEKPLLTNEDKNYLKVLFIQCKQEVSYIAIIKRYENRYLRVRYGMSKMYSYIRMPKGFEGLSVDKNYTLQELGF